MSSLAVVHHDAIVKIATARNLLVAVWSDAPLLGQMHAFGRAMHQAQRVNPAGVALLNVLRGGTPRFADGVRDEARRLTAGGGCALGVAHLVVVPGLAGAASRAFLGTVNLLGRPPVPTRVFGLPAEALTWLHDRLAKSSQPWTSTELEDLYAEVVQP